MSTDITFATKIWGGEWLPTLNRHPEAQLIIGNNLKGRRFIDLGDIDDYYFIPELEAVWKCQTKYLVWYAGDVIPPETNWLKDAMPLLKRYPIVTCLWAEGGETPFMTPTKFGWENYHFSDQCYVAETETMRNIDYNVDHPIKEFYPDHGGNSFERRVAQWLAHNRTPMAVLKNHLYHHIPTGEKQLV